MIERYETDRYDEAFVRMLRQAQTISSLSDRVAHFSKVFFGTPYMAGANGEGPLGEFDQMPLYRDDGFDCLTYVNTVLALAHATSFDIFKKNIIKTNYRHSVAYENRLHFMSVDWNPVNEKNNYIKNITPEIGDRLAVSPLTATALIDRPNWFRHRDSADIKRISALGDIEMSVLINKLHSLGAQLTAEEGVVPYLSKNNITTRLADYLPEVSIMEIVRPNWNLREKIGTNLNVSHLGFVLNQKKGLVFRHAGLNAGCVTEQDLMGYISGLQENATIGGVSFFSVC